MPATLAMLRYPDAYIAFSARHARPRTVYAATSRYRFSRQAEQNAL